MGILTRAGNVIGDIARNVPAGSKRDRMLNVLASGIEGTQNVLAGKYAQDLQQALSPANTAQYAPLAYGLIGAGGSVAGNVLSDEQKDPGRILAEAAGAGALGALGGRVIGGAGAKLQQARATQAPVMAAYEQAATEYLNRARMAGQAGARQTGLAAQARAADVIGNMAAGEAAMNKMAASTRGRQGLYMAAIPALAGLGGMAGGGVSDFAQMAGVPGFNQNVITDPEFAGSSNTQMARMATPTLRYIG
jgi:hypothetical protein